MHQAVLLPLVNGLAQSAILFLAAAGLSLVFGVLRVVNFAHGSFMMLGAYVAWSLVASQGLSLAAFVVAVLGAGLIVALLGAATEVVIIRRTYGSTLLHVVVVTYAVLLLIDGLVQLKWGNAPLSLNLPDLLAGGTPVFGVMVPVYSLLLIAIGLVAGAGLWLFLQGTATGRLIRAAAADNQMSEALGVNVPRIFTIVFSVGICVAALGGALSAPTVSLSPGMGLNQVIQAFAVVVVGGLGSIPGALLAAVLLGVVDSFLTSYLPVLSGITFYLGMAAVLLVRPQGLLGGR